MVNLNLTKPEEIVRLLCTRLRKERLAQQMKQSEVAARAGIGIGTLSNLEAGRSVAFDSVVRVAMALGRLNDLENVFSPRLDSLGDIERYNQGAERQRIRGKSSNS